MTRFSSATNATEAAKPAIRMVVAVELDFSSGFVRAHDGTGKISIGGNDYLGLGDFGGIETAEEASDMVSKPLKLTLSGVDSSLVSTTMTETYQNRTATVYLAFIDDQGALIDTPETVWEGRMNQMSLSVSQGAATISLTCEHRLRREPRIARYTDADQQLLFDGDLFFNKLHTIPGYAGRWGEKNVYGSSSGGGGGGDGTRSELTNIRSR